MDMDEVRTILSDSRVDVWELIEGAIKFASVEHGDELKKRRDGIVEKLYLHCPNCEETNHQPQQANQGDNDNRLERSPLSTPMSKQNEDANDDDDNHDKDPDLYGGLFDDDDELTVILRIKDQLEDPNQPEDAVIELLQSLADMDLTFKTLKETDIGRHVNQLRKHPSGDVRGLVKQLVRKWKDLVDEWVGSNGTQTAHSSVPRADGDSPLVNNASRNLHNDRHQHQTLDLSHSPNRHNGSSGSERNYSEVEQKPKKAIPKREAPSRPLPASSSAPPPNRAREDPNVDLDRLASARKRLHDNYQEAENAKKQRTIQVMDIHDIPKPRNGYIAKNKGGFQGRNHR